MAYFFKSIAQYAPAFPPITASLQIRIGSFCCGGQVIDGLFYPVAHGSPTTTSPYYEEITAHLGCLMAPNRTVFVEGWLQHLLPWISILSPIIPILGPTFLEEQNFGNGSFDRLLTFFQYRTAQDIRGNMQSCRILHPQLKKITHQRSVKSLSGDPAKITYDSLRMALIMSDHLHHTPECTDFVVVCGALHVPQLRYYLRHPDTLYQHTCQLFDHIRLPYTALPKAQAHSWGDLAAFLALNPFLQPVHSS